MSARVAAALLAAAVAWAMWAAAGLTGIAYSLLFAAAVAPGIPLGIALFGPRHPAAWAGGALAGYGLTQLACWAAIAGGYTAPIAFAVSWLVVLGGTTGLSRLIGERARIDAAPWSARDLRALFLVLLLVPGLMGITYRNLGREDAAGNRYYRAYFTADFLWHSALAYELGKFSLPPRNPYLAHRPMNYYWTYFLLPATVAKLAPAPAQDQSVQRYLKANALLVGLLMLAALFVLVRSGVESPGPAVAATTLAVLAASAEGSYAVLDLLVRGRPLSGLLDINADAVTGWPPFNGLRIDNIPRSLWYTPQHTTSIALGLVGLTMGVLAGASARPMTIAGAGLALGLSTTMNPLLGAACSLIYGVCILADGLFQPGSFTAIARHALAAAFVAAAVMWGAASRVMDGAGSALNIGFSGFSRHSPVVTLLLSLGPVLIPALPGMRHPRTDVARRAVAVGVSGICLGLFLLYFVRISEASWVGFRAGQILLVSIPILLARTLERMRPGWRAAVVALVFALGAATTAIDTYNAQDIENRRPGPGFRWTLWTTRDQERAFAWIRGNTPETAVVQMEPILRGREHWTLIPSFAGRRMAAGQPISLLPIPEYGEKSAQVRTLFATASLDEARTIAHRLRIDYLYVDRDDLAAYPDGTRKFDTLPDSFERVFANDEVRLYRVK